MTETLAKIPALYAGDKQARASITRWKAIQKTDNAGAYLLETLLSSLGKSELVVPSGLVTSHVATVDKLRQN